MVQAFILLLIIGGAWAIFLVPPLLNSRRETPLASTEEYSRITQRLSTVQTDRSSALPMRAGRSQVLARRRRVLGLFVLLAVGTLAYAIFKQSIMWLMGHILVDAGIAWYVAILLQIKQSRSVVRLDSPDAAPVRFGTPSDAPVRVIAS
ncbi:MAG: hypothetical protein OEO77_05905 [Acidimicrobiia bacterium]|nr:hypothetical protein [Acidimicrobiia bacterium]